MKPAVDADVEDGSLHTPSTEVHQAQLVASSSCRVCQDLEQRQQASKLGALRQHFNLLSRPQHLLVRSRWGALRKEAARLLESRGQHILVIALVVFDLALVVTELVLSSSYCSEEHKPPAVHTAEEVLRWISISILIFFCLELLLKLLVFGPHYFLHSWLHLLDMVVVVSSLVLELALHGLASEVVALLVFFRLWRVVRIIHSVAEALEMTHEKEVEKHHAEMQRMGEELEQHRQRAQQLERELQEVRHRPAAAAVTAGAVSTGLPAAGL